VMQLPNSIPLCTVLTSLSSLPLCVCFGCVKAHPDVLTLMLQVFDEGRLTDGKGKTIHCPNAIFIMTSNLVQDEIREAIQEGEYQLRPDTSPLPTVKPDPLPNTVDTIVPSSSLPSVDPSVISHTAKSTDEFLRHQIHPILKRHFRREEFLGRINDIVVFHPLEDKDLKETVETELGRWREKAKERHGIRLEWSERLVESLKGGYDERYGYRSMIYTVEKRVVNLLAASHERDMIGKGCIVELDVEDEAKDDCTKIAHQKVIIKKVTKIPDEELEREEKEKKGGKGWFKNLF
jgi:ATP-dependent Clp protease ATP-binding subunit ClpB